MRIGTNGRYLDDKGREWLLSGLYASPENTKLRVLGVWNKTYGPGDFLGQRCAVLFNEDGTSNDGVTLVEEVS